MRRELLPLSIVAAAWVAFLLSWPNAPAQVPTHFGFDGRPDAWAPRSFSSWFFPALLHTGIYLFLTAAAWLPRDGREPLVKTTSYLVFRCGVLLALLTNLVASLKPEIPAAMSGFLLAEFIVMLALGVFQSRWQRRTPSSRQEQHWRRWLFLFPAAAAVLVVGSVLPGVIAIALMAVPSVWLLAWVLVQLWRGEADVDPRSVPSA